MHTITCIWVCRAKDYETEGYEPYWTYPDGSVAPSKEQADEAPEPEEEAEADLSRTASGSAMPSAAPAMEAAAEADASPTTSLLPAEAAAAAGPAADQAVAEAAPDGKENEAPSKRTRQGKNPAPRARRSGPASTAAAPEEAPKAATRKRSRAAILASQQTGAAIQLPLQSASQQLHAAAHVAIKAQPKSQQAVAGKQARSAKRKADADQPEHKDKPASQADADGQGPQAAMTRRQASKGKAAAGTAVGEGKRGRGRYRHEDVSEASGRKQKKPRTSPPASEVGPWHPMQALRAVAGLALRTLSPWQGDQ